MLYLAMSCLQGRLASQAYMDLASLKPDGIQLTPGNVIDPAFLDIMEKTTLKHRTHNGFSWKAMRKPIWSDLDEDTLTGHWDSIHAPSFADHPSFWSSKYLNQMVWEIMYPKRHNYHLSTWAELDYAMSHNLQLAVDISHLELIGNAYQRDFKVIERLLNYTNIKEIHISAPHEHVDAHKPLTDLYIKNNKFMLILIDWAKERLASGTPVVLECYMHRLSQDDRQRQIDLIR